MFPEQIGDYHILEQLGKGGMGVVYKAQSPLEMVALKVISPEIAQNQEFAQRFLREMQVISTLKDDNIVRCVDFGVDVGQNLYFMALEYVEGETLESQLQREGAMGLVSALKMVQWICRGLQHAWQKVIIHRDIKPENILVNREGRPKIADFGLAKFVSSGDLTKVGTMVGTPLYIAPEQAFLLEEDVDIRSDIYSLGITLFCMLTGRPPFLGKNAMEVLNAHRVKPLPSMEEFCPGLPWSVESLVIQMTAKKQEDRFNTPKDVCVAIGEILEKKEVLNYRDVATNIHPESSALSLTQTPTKIVPHKVFALGQHLISCQILTEDQLETLLINQDVETPDQLKNLMFSLGITTPEKLQSALAQAEKIHCANCNREMEPTWIVCPYCSTDLQAGLSTPSLKILIGERDERALDEMEEFFRSIYPQASILGTWDGQRAKETIEKEKPQVIFLHCFLPKITGIELCRLLHESAEFGSLPVFILTDAYLPLLKDRSYSAGARDFLTKPLNKGEIKVKIDSLVSSKPLNSTPPPSADSPSPFLSQSQVMIGKLQVISLPELIQSFHRTAETGILTVSQEDKEGNIYFQKGKVINADCKIEGEVWNKTDAFFEILCWKGGSFHFRNRQPQVEDQLPYNTMALLMEALRLLDESEME